jgi:hypothetical protein
MIASVCCAISMCSVKSRSSGAISSCTRIASRPAVAPTTYAPSGECSRAEPRRAQRDRQLHAGARRRERHGTAASSGWRTG